MVTIYTDGSSRGNPGPGGYAAVVSYKKTVESKGQEWVTEIGGREDHTTNNRMELLGAIKAIEFASELSTDDCLLFTDSQYVMKGITEWVHNWQKKGWRTANKKPVLNQDLWQELLAVTEKIKSSGKKLEWKYVAGHAGIDLNERADVIATSFADNLPPSLYDGPKDRYK